VGVNQTAANAITLGTLCGEALTSQFRQQYGYIAYRYQYAGNWSNTDPFPWMGAYHASDLPMLFGTYDAARGNGTELEIETSQTMEDFLFAFVSDPINGPKGLGWVPFDASAPDGGTMLRFGGDGKAVQNVSGNAVEGVCTGNGTLDWSP
jgi:carboxylesterase type B